MHIRCPHCHNPVDVVDDSSFRDLVCDSCGGHFSLVSGTDETETARAAAKTIGHFQLVEQLGIGAFGAVWKANDTQLDRPVAIKCPRKGQLNESETESFLREARAAAQLKHPNIVSVHEVGKSDESLYIVSEYVEGADLKQWLGGQPLPPREAAELCAKIAEALHHAHEKGVIHRDLKPGNIMMDLNGEPHIMDFGLAKRESGEITLTVDGAILGTPAYMSPEQARGEGHAADCRSDIYSLGVLLFEMLTGELPFRGEKRMLIVQILKEEPPSLRKLNSLVPKDLETICLKCLEKPTERRFPTALALAHDLRRWLDHKPILSRPVSRLERAMRWSRRQPVVASLLAVVFLVTFGGLAAVTWHWRKAEKATLLAQDNFRRSEEHRQQRELNFRRSLEAVDKMLTRVGAREFAANPELTPIRKAILEDAAELYESFLEERADDPVLMAEVARSLMRVGAINKLLGETEQSLGSYSSARKLLASFLDTPDTEESLQNSLQQCCSEQADLFLSLRCFPEALEACNSSLTFLKQVEAESPSGDSAYQLAMELLACANIQRLSGQPRTAQATYLQSIACFERAAPLLTDKRSLIYCYSNQAAALSQLAPLLSRANDEQTAEQYLSQSVALLEKSIAASSSDQIWNYESQITHLPDVENRSSLRQKLARAHQALADLLNRAQRPDEARQHADKALELVQDSVSLQEKVAAKSDDRTELLLLMKNYLAHASHLQAAGLVYEAVTQLDKALETGRALREKHPRDSQVRKLENDLLTQKGRILFQSEDLKQEGVALFKSAFESWVSNYSSLEELLLPVATAAREWAYLAYQLHRAGFSTESEFILRQLETTLDTWSTQDRFSPTSDFERTRRLALGTACHFLAGLLQFDRNEPATAIEYYERAIAEREWYLTRIPNDALERGQLAHSYANMSQALGRQRRPNDAVRAGIKATEHLKDLIRRRSLVAHHTDRCMGLYIAVANHLINGAEISPEDLTTLTTFDEEAYPERLYPAYLRAAAAGFNRGGQFEDAARSITTLEGLGVELENRDLTVRILSSWEVGQQDAALSAFQTLLGRSLNGQSSASQFVKIAADRMNLTEEKRLRLARDYYSQAIRESADRPESRRNWIKYVRNSADWEQAGNDLNELLKQQPGAILRLFQVEVELHLGKIQPGVAHLQDCLEQLHDRSTESADEVRDIVGLLTMLAGLFGKQEIFDEQIVCYQSAAFLMEKEFGDMPADLTDRRTLRDLHGQLGASYILQKQDHARGIEACRKALPTGESIVVSPQANKWDYFLLGWYLTHMATALWELEEREKAIEIETKAMEAREQLLAMDVGTRANVARLCETYQRLERWTQEVQETDGEPFDGYQRGKRHFEFLQSRGLKQEYYQEELEKLHKPSTATDATIN